MTPTFYASVIAAHVGLFFAVVLFAAWAL